MIIGREDRPRDRSQSDPSGRIRSGPAAQGDHVTIVVKDNGKGMNHESLERFQQFASGQFPEEYGTHVGLRSVMERLNLYFDGHVDFEIESEEGRGTEIHIALPRESDS